MSIEISMLISVISVSFAIYFGLSNKKRVDCKDIEKQVSEQAGICFKLEVISDGIKDIKTDINAIRTELKDHDKRIIKLEESDKSQWLQLDKASNRHSTK